MFARVPDLFGSCLESKVEWGNASVYSLQDSGMLSHKICAVCYRRTDNWSSLS